MAASNARLHLPSCPHRDSGRRPYIEVGGEVGRWAGEWSCDIELPEQCRLNPENSLEAVGCVLCRGFPSFVAPAIPRFVFAERHIHCIVD